MCGEMKGHLSGHFFRHSPRSKTLFSSSPLDDVHFFYILPHLIAIYKLKVVAKSRQFPSETHGFGLCLFRE